LNNAQGNNIQRHPSYEIKKIKSFEYALIDRIPNKNIFDDNYFDNYYIDFNKDFPIFPELVLKANNNYFTNNI